MPSTFLLIHNFVTQKKHVFYNWSINNVLFKLPLNKDVYTQTMLMARHQRIAKLFDEEFGVTR